MQTSHPTQKPHKRNPRGLILLPLLALALGCGGGYLIAHQRLAGEREREIARADSITRELDSITSNQEGIAKDQQLRHNSHASPADYVLLQDRCDTQQCLMHLSHLPEFLFGICEVQGEISVGQDSAWGMSDTCLMLTLTGGNQPLINSLRNLIRAGNAVQWLDEEGRVVVPLGTRFLSHSELLSLTNRKGPISLLVFRPQPGETWAAPCHPGFEVLRILDAKASP